MAATAPSEVTEPLRLQPADTHPADVLAASAGGKGLRAHDGAAPHEGRGVTPAGPPLLGTDPHRFREQAVRHGGLLHLPRSHTEEPSRSVHSYDLFLSSFDCMQSEKHFSCFPVNFVFFRVGWQG